MPDRTALGIDIGGTAIKAGVVNLKTGEVVGKRLSADTPDARTPEAMAETVAKLVKRGAVSEAPLCGIGLPAVIKHGVVTTASNIDESWLGVNAAEAFGDAIGRPVAVLNDADAAGIAEVRFGVGRGVPGVIAMITLG